VKIRTSGTLVRLSLGALLATAACRTPAGPLPGAPTPRAAVEQFMGAVRAQDLQAMSIVWGTTKGAARDQIDRTELERRELLMMCYLTHDRYQVQGEQTTVADRHTLAVSVTRGRLTRTTNFTTVTGPSNRWYVEDVDLTHMQDFCSQR
jgi:hypothetical protein